MAFDQYSIFLVVAFLIMLSPGPAVVLAITNGILHGRRGAAISVFGNMTGLLILSGVSVAGVGAILAANVLLFEILKWCGGLYLVYLGISLWRSKKQRLGVREQIDQVKTLSPRQLYQRGLMVTFSNPKAIVFVTALLPQFMHLHKPILPQFAILIGTMLVMQLLVLNAYAFLSSQIRNWLNSPGRLQLLHKIIGASFIGFGISLALSSNPQ